MPFTVFPDSSLADDGSSNRPCDVAIAVKLVVTFPRLSCTDIEFIGVQSFLFSKYLSKSGVLASISCFACIPIIWFEVMGISRMLIIHVPPVEFRVGIVKSVYFLMVLGLCKTGNSICLTPEISLGGVLGQMKRKSASPAAGWPGSSVAKWFGSQGRVIVHSIFRSIVSLPWANAGSARTKSATLVLVSFKFMVVFMSIAKSTSKWGLCQERRMLAHLFRVNKQKSDCNMVRKYEVKTMGMLSNVEQRIGYNAKRHEILAGNIANAQTPGYAAKDLKNTGTFGGALAMVKTNSAHLVRMSASEGVEVRVAKSGSLPSLDGNTVDLDLERGLMAQNALDLEAQIRFATHYLRQQQTAAT